MPRIGGRLTEEQRGRSYGSRYTYVHWEATQPVITIYANLPFHVNFYMASVKSPQNQFYHLYQKRSHKSNNIP